VTQERFRECRTTLNWSVFIFVFVNAFSVDWHRLSHSRRGHLGDRRFKVTSGMVKSSFMNDILFRSCTKLAIRVSETRRHPMTYAKASKIATYTYSKVSYAVLIAADECLTAEIAKRPWAKLDLELARRNIRREADRRATAGNFA
jgi:hypothetical protein